MRFIATLLLCLFSISAEARTSEPFDRHALYSVGSEAVITERAVRKVRTVGLKQIRKKHQKRKHRIAPANYATASLPLVEKARAYIGQTAAQIGVRRSLWCSAFLRFITNATGVNDLAKSWLSKERVSPSVGAIAVLSRGRNGGHVGVVSGFDSRGNPIIISGNHRGRVAESPYSKHRVIAYVKEG